MKITVNRTQQQIDNDIENLELEIENANKMREYYGSE